MYTNLNEVIRLNPQHFTAKKAAQINFSSTEYNFVTFEKPKASQAQITQASKTSLASKQDAIGHSSKSIASCRNSVAGKIAQPLHNSNFMTAQITT